MSVVFSGSWSGSFGSTGASEFINLPAGADWLQVYNFTQLNSGSAGAGQVVQAYWQRGMPTGEMVVYTKTAVTDALVPDVAADAIFFADNTINIPGTPYAISAISNATPPRVSTATTTNLYNGAIVRIYQTTGALQLQGMDFTISNLSAGAHFDLAFMQPIAAGTTGSYAWIPYNPYFYPSTRYITNISQATEAIVTLSVTHNYTIGQEVRLVIPQLTATSYGMGPLNGVQATIVDIGQADTDGYTNTITINVDTTGFPAFVFPTTTTPLGSRAQVVPIGEQTSEALAQNQNILADATLNTGEMGLVLSGGVGNPAGVANDLIFWVAGKSFNQ